jgi:hypothetical protein
MKKKLIIAWCTAISFYMEHWSGDHIDIHALLSITSLHIILNLLRNPDAHNPDKS